MKQREISNENQIEMYFHCALCLEEWKQSKEISAILSPKEYQEVQVGFTPIGIQVWCNRHNCNIVHIDFQGQKHPANTSRKKEAA